MVDLDVLAPEGVGPAVDLRRPVVAEPVAEVRRVVVAEDRQVCAVHEGLRHQPGVRVLVLGVRYEGPRFRRAG